MEKNFRNCFDFIINSGGHINIYAKEFNNIVCIMGDDTPEICILESPYEKDYLNLKEYLSSYGCDGVPMDETIADYLCSDEPFIPIIKYSIENKVKYITSSLAKKLFSSEQISELISLLELVRTY